MDAWYLKSNRKVLRSSSDTRNNIREMRTRCANARWPKNISRRNSVSVTELTRSERDETHSIQKTVLPYQSPFLTITIVCRDNSSAGPAVCRAGDRPSQSRTGVSAAKGKRIGTIKGRDGGLQGRSSDLVNSILLLRVETVSM